MGMFDELKCKYLLPIPGTQDLLYQTKDTPAQFLDTYEIHADGTLWHEAYEIEDKSDPTKEGLERLVGMLTRVNTRWEQLHEFTGEIRFYGSRTEKWSEDWVEYSAYFVKGAVKHLEIIRNDEVCKPS